MLNCFVFKVYVFKKWKFRKSEKCFIDSFLLIFNTILITFVPHYVRNNNNVYDNKKTHILCNNNVCNTKKNVIICNKKHVIILYYMYIFSIYF